MLYRFLILFVLLTLPFMFTTLSRADNGAILENLIQKQDCKFYMYRKEILDLIRQEKSLWAEYKKLSSELEVNRVMTKAYGNGETDAALELNLRTFYDEKIRPIAEKLRPAQHDASGMVEVMLGGKFLKGTITGDVVDSGSTGLSLTNPRIKVGNRTYYIASTVHSSTADEIARALGFRAGAGGLHDVVHSANSLHPSNWLTGIRKYIIYDVERQVFRPIEKRDLESYLWVYFYPKDITLYR